MTIPLRAVTSLQATMLNNSSWYNWGAAQYFLHFLYCRHHLHNRNRHLTWWMVERSLNSLRYFYCEMNLCLFYRCSMSFKHQPCHSVRPWSHGGAVVSKISRVHSQWEEWPSEYLRQGLSVSFGILSAIFHIISRKPWPLQMDAYYLDWLDIGL